MTSAANLQGVAKPTGRPAAIDKQCVFQVGSSWYSLLATAVREVMMAPDLVPVPGSHAAMGGLCHVRNEFVPAILLGPLLGESAGGRKPANKMLLLSGTSGNWALLVEEVVALESLEVLINPDARISDMKCSDMNISDMSSTTVMGTATFRDRVVRVLDANFLYRRAEELLQTCWSNLVQPLDDASTATSSER